MLEKSAAPRWWIGTKMASTTLLSEMQMALSNSSRAHGDGAVVRATLEQNPFEDIDVGSWSSPEVVDWDKDGVNDLLLGNADDTLQFFKGFRDGTVVRATPEQNLFQSIDVGKVSSPKVVDWDKDGINDLIVGNADGTLQLFKGSQ